MDIRKRFPLGKAYGKAFCNRTVETKKLKGHFESGKHTFILAPRRYGKSSLCEHAFLQSHFAWAKVDFYIAVTIKDVETLLLNGISALISQSLGSVEKLLHIIKKEENSLPAENIAEALLILEQLLKEKGKQAVLLLDEFQEIGQMDGGRGLEGAIRHAAQETAHLSLIFCGSYPNLLKTMFEDERRPLYKLCRKLVLHRIEEEHYLRHINDAATEQWGEALSDVVFKAIMSLTERHPYYVNYLCDVVFSECETPPTLEDINMAWHTVVEEEQSDLIKDFALLSDNQRKLLRYIANHGGHALHSTEAAKLADISNNSLSRAISSLVEKDYIEKIGNIYRLVVPAYQALLVEKSLQ